MHLIDISVSDAEENVSVAQMKKNGFQRFVGLDGSEAMLEIAKESGLYEDVKQCILGDDPFPVTWGDYVDQRS